MRFFRRYNCGDFGRFMIMRKELDVRVLVLGNVLIVWDPRKRAGGAV